MAAVDVETWRAATGNKASRRGRTDMTTGPAGPPPDPTPADRDSLGAYGTYKPDASNTGVIAGTVLTDYNSSGTTGSVTFSTAGQTVTGKRIYGDVKIAAANISFINCELLGGINVPSGNTGVIDCNSSACVNFLAKDCTIYAQRPSYYRDGIVGHEYTATRCHIYNTNDGCGAFAKPGGGGNCNVLIQGSYIHTRVYWKNDPAHSDGTHNDGVQYQGGTGLTVVGNTIVNDSIPSVWAPGYSTSSPSGPPADKTDLFPHALGAAITLQDNVGYGTTNVLIEKNWLDDGVSTINVKPGTYTIRNNRFGRNQYHYTSTSWFVIRADSRSGTTFTGGLSTNVYDDTGAVLTESNKGIYFNA